MTPTVVKEEASADDAAGFKKYVNSPCFARRGRVFPNDDVGSSSGHFASDVSRVINQWGSDLWGKCPQL